MGWARDRRDGVVRSVRSTVWLGMVLLALGCGPAKHAGTVKYASGKDSTTPDGLHRVLWEPFRSTYVRPGASLQGYSGLRLEEVTIRYKAPPSQRRKGFSGDAFKTNYALPPSMVATFKRHFHETFVRELSQSTAFTVAETTGPEVLVLRPRIVDLQVTVPPDRHVNADERVFTDSAGRMTLVLDVVDPKTGKAIVRVGQARPIEMADGGWYKSDATSNWMTVRRIFRRWAADLRRQLDKYHAMPSLPPLQSARAGG